MRLMEIRMKSNAEGYRSQHYEIEKEYALKIIASLKNSDERTHLLREAYDAIKAVTDRYSPGLSERQVIRE